MQFEKVQIKLVPDKGKGRLRAFASVCFAGGWWLSGIKIIENTDSSHSVFFPTIPIVIPCPYCETQIPLTSRYCPQCGKSNPTPIDDTTGGGAFRRLVHCDEFQTKVDGQKEVLAAYKAEKENAENGSRDKKTD